MMVAPSNLGRFDGGVTYEKEKALLQRYVVHIFGDDVR